MVGEARVRTERLPKAKAGTYLRKAAEFSRAALRAAEAGDWNAVGLNSVHAVISALDALTTYYLQERSRSQDHGDALLLAERIDLPGVRARVRQAEEVLRAKNLVEYEARSLERAEAEAMQKKAQRLLAWVGEQVEGA